MEAILAQSFPPREILVVDDASTDDSVSVIQSVIRKNPSVRLERNERNLGILLTIQRWYATLSGEYVFHASADDRVLPSFFQKSVALLARHPQAGFCSTLALVVEPNGAEPRPYNTPTVCPRPGYLPPSKCREAYHRLGTWVVPHSVVYRRTAYLEAGGFNPELAANADNLIYRVLSAKHGSCYIPEPLMLWRPSPDSFSRRATLDLGMTIKSVQRVEHEMRTTFGSIFSPEDIATMKRPALSWALEDLLQRPPGYDDDFLRMSRALGGGYWLDRPFRAAWRAHLLSGWLGLKIYHFLLQPGAERRRLLVRKLRGLMSGRA